jgi:hypothetical protein
MANVVPVPIRSKVVEAAGVLTRDLVRFLDTLRNWLSQTTRQVAAVELTAQAAAITTTSIPTPVLETGLYRATYSLRITQAATSSSSAAVTFGWTTNAVSCSQAFAAVTGNTTASQSSGSVTVAVDTATAVTYAVAYSSTGATAMTYALDVRLEVLP